MRRVGLVLAISAVALALIPGPAKAQTEPPSLGCIPTSDTPFQTGLTGEFEPGDVLLLIDPSGPIDVGVTNPGPIATFPAGIREGFYDLWLFNFQITDVPVFVGSIQIGNCTPTSKEQCKNGGWRNYLQFTNQGQCLRFVNHGP
jgi:hypothetical protein